MTYVGWDYLRSLEAAITGGVAVVVVAASGAAFWAAAGAGLALGAAWLGAFFRLRVERSGITLETGYLGLVTRRVRLPPGTSVDVVGLGDWGDAGEDGAEVCAELRDPNGGALLEELGFGARSHANTLASQVHRDLEAVVTRREVGWRFYGRNERWPTRLAIACARWGLLKATARIDADVLSVGIRGAMFAPLIRVTAHLIVLIAIITAMNASHAATREWFAALGLVTLAVGTTLAAATTQTVEYAPRCIRARWSVFGITTHARHYTCPRRYDLLVFRTLRSRHPESVYVDWPRAMQQGSLGESRRAAEARTEWAWPSLVAPMRSWFGKRLRDPPARARVS